MVLLGTKNVLLIPLLCSVLILFIKYKLKEIQTWTITSTDMVILLQTCLIGASRILLFFFYQHNFKIHKVGICRIIETVLGCTSINFSCTK